MNPLHQWLSMSSQDQKQQLAATAGSSIPSLRLAAKGYRTAGAVNLSAEFAARIEQAAATINAPLLPKIHREDLCGACAQCPYQIKCNSK